MATEIPTNRSPRTPTQAPRSTDRVFHNPEHPIHHTPQQEYQMASYSPNGTRLPSRAGSRQEDVPGGVVGLPGSGDYTVDPSMFNEFLFPGTLPINWSPVNNVNLQQGWYPFNNFNLQQSYNYYPDLQVPQYANPIQFQGFNPQAVLDYSQSNQIAYHQPYNNFQLAAQPLNYTTGLTATPRVHTVSPQQLTASPLVAIPQGYNLVPELPTTLPTYPNPEASAVTYSIGPYFRQPLTWHPDDLLPVDPQLEQSTTATAQQDTASTAQQGTATTASQDMATTAPQAPAPDHPQGGSTKPEPDSESDDEAVIVKRTSKGKQVKRKRGSDPESEDDAPISKREYVQARGGSSQRPRSDSTVSESSSLAKPMDLAVIRAGEKPKKVEDKSWIRINNTTKGETTRTARINQFTDAGNVYKIKPLICGNWATDKHTFEYVNKHGMDHFKDIPWSAAKVYEYITQCPAKLRLWIQVTPGDSARRYATKSHSECIFKACPNRVWANKGTIEVGNYRVAFDEKHNKYNKDGEAVVDPFDCVGYAHLYCMERFLDFADVCQHVDVKVDTRNDMPKEPKGEPAFIFSKKHKPERLLAEKFIKAARHGRLHKTPEFVDYPHHSDYRKGERKPHEQTLVSAMFTANWEHRPISQVKQFVCRSVKPSSCGIHRGDQEIIVADKQVECTKEYKKSKGAKKHKGFDFTRYYDNIDPMINIRIGECLALKAKFEHEDAQGTTRTRKKRGAAEMEDEQPTRSATTRRQKQSKRKSANDMDSDDEAEPWQESDDDDDDDDDERQIGHLQNVQTRSSPRKKQRLNYTEPQDMPLQSQYCAVNYAQATSSGLQTSPADSPKFPKDMLYLTAPDTPVDYSKDYKNGPSLEEMLSLERRKSSAAWSRGSIMKSRKVNRNRVSPYTARTASFEAHPVSSSKEYNVNDPPRKVSGPYYVRRRSSARLASK